MINFLSERMTPKTAMLIGPAVSGILAVIWLLNEPYINLAWAHIFLGFLILTILALGWPMLIASYSKGPYKWEIPTDRDWYL